MKGEEDEDEFHLAPEFSNAPSDVLSKACAKAPCSDAELKRACEAWNAEAGLLDMDDGTTVCQVVVVDDEVLRAMNVDTVEGSLDAEAAEKAARELMLQDEAARRIIAAMTKGASDSVGTYYAVAKGVLGKAAESVSGAGWLSRLASKGGRMLPSGGLRLWDRMGSFVTSLSFMPSILSAFVKVLRGQVHSHAPMYRLKVAKFTGVTGFSANRRSYDGLELAVDYIETMFSKNWSVIDGVMRVRFAAFTALTGIPVVGEALEAVRSVLFDAIQIGVRDGLLNATVGALEQERQCKLDPSRHDAKQRCDEAKLLRDFFTPTSWSVSQTSMQQLAASGPPSNP